MNTNEQSVHRLYIYISTSIRNDRNIESHLVTSDPLQLELTLAILGGTIDLFAYVTLALTASHLTFVSEILYVRIDATLLLENEAIN